MNCDGGDDSMRTTVRGREPAPADDDSVTVPIGMAGADALNTGVAICAIDRPDTSRFGRHADRAFAGDAS